MYIRQAVSCLYRMFTNNNYDRHKKWIPKSSRRTREEWESKHGTTSDIVYEGLLSLVRMCKKLILLKNNTQVL